MPYRENSLSTKTTTCSPKFHLVSRVGICPRVSQLCLIVCQQQAGEKAVMTRIWKMEETGHSYCLPQGGAALLMKSRDLGSPEWPIISSFSSDLSDSPCYLPSHSQKTVGMIVIVSSGLCLYWGLLIKPHPSCMILEECLSSFLSFSYLVCKMGITMTKSQLSLKFHNISGELSPMPATL